MYQIHRCALRQNKQKLKRAISIGLNNGSNYPIHSHTDNNPMLLIIPVMKVKSDLRTSEPSIRSSVWRRCRCWRRQTTTLTTSSPSPSGSSGHAIALSGSDQSRSGTWAARRRDCRGWQCRPEKCFCKTFLQKLIGKYRQYSKELVN